MTSGSSFSTSGIPTLGSSSSTSGIPTLSSGAGAVPLGLSSQQQTLATIMTTSTLGQTTPCEKKMAEVGGLYVSNVIYPGQQPLSNANSRPDDLTNGNGINFGLSSQDNYIIVVNFNSKANLNYITISGNTNSFQVQLLGQNGQPITQQNNVLSFSSTQGVSPTINNFGSAGTSVYGVKIILINTVDNGYELFNYFRIYLFIIVFFLFLDHFKMLT
jgi:hypothetical protein